MQYCIAENDIDFKEMAHHLKVVLVGTILIGVNSVFCQYLYF